MVLFLCLSFLDWFFRPVNIQKNAVQKTYSFFRITTKEYELDLCILFIFYFP